MITPEQIAKYVAAEAARHAAQRASQAAALEAMRRNMARGKPDTFNDNKAGRSPNTTKKNNINNP